MAGGGTIELLRAMVRMHDGDVAAALREFTGLTTQEMADLVELPRQNVEQALQRTDGRKWAHVLRALEPAIGLNPFDLDTITPD